MVCRGRFAWHKFVIAGRRNRRIQAQVPAQRFVPDLDMSQGPTGEEIEHLGGVVAAALKGPLQPQQFVEETLCSLL